MISLDSIVDSWSPDEARKGKPKAERVIIPGAFDDLGEVSMSEEIFIDEKPDVYSLTGDAQKITSAEAKAIFDSVAAEG